VDSCGRLDAVQEKYTLCGSGAVVGDRQQGSTPQRDRQGGKHLFLQTIEFIQAQGEKNVKQKEAQAKSYPPRNFVVSCAETC
jgi:hypothetical protein